MRDTAVTSRPVREFRYARRARAKKIVDIVSPGTILSCRRVSSSSHRPSTRPVARLRRFHRQLTVVDYAVLPGSQVEGPEVTETAVWPPRSTAIPQGRDLKGLSGLDEANLEKSILRRGLATPAEIEACKAHRTKLAAKSKDSSPSLLEIMVDAKVLTRSQMIRLLQEKGEGTRKFEIPGYQILDRLGKGSMGVVYKARQVSVDRIVAVKILLDSLAQNKEFIKRFEREAKIAAKLSHNNIVNAIDAGEVGRPLLLRDGIRRGADDQGLPRQEQDLRREGGHQDRDGRRRGAQARQPAGADPPRRQARERDPHQGRRRQARRPGTGPADRRREVGPVRGRHGDRHPLLHQPRAGPRPDRHRHPGRHLQPGGDVLSHGHRQGPLRRRDPQRGDAEARRRKRPARPPRPPQHPALERPGHGRRDDAGQEPRASLLQLPTT